MRILVTGADGFVGVWLVGRLVGDGHDVVAGVRPDRPLFTLGGPPPWPASVRAVPLEVLDESSVRAALGQPLDAVVHLAAVASGAEARRMPEATRSINVGGTLRITGELARQRQAGESDVRMLLVSTGEVYGAGLERPRQETDPVAPVSAYAESKREAEDRAMEIAHGGGLALVIARPFPHTGRGQDERFVVPSFARRIWDARRSGRQRVPVGNLKPIREFLHVSDVVAAYVDLLRHGAPGETYNVARGEGVGLDAVFRRIAELVGHDAEPEVDPGLLRPADIPHLVGDASKLSARTGWKPRITLDETLAEVVDAQAH